MIGSSALAWIKDIHDPQQRGWEEFYRNRWQYDKVVRSTHGVNCTGGCTWMIYVKNGLVTWELQGLDYGSLEAGLPPYEPRGCQRGITFSWHLYSPTRVRYPYIRGALRPPVGGGTSIFGRANFLPREAKNSAMLSMEL